ncbi:MAG: fumarylacetoacetase, partial [Candidatus Eremiobacteraeota bacterium]|nr:fumarylacetoacetase [Candidatus Eremiobacteraeota bacterium]
MIATRLVDPSVESWISVAPDSDFPIQNLPYGVFRRPGEDARVGVAIGNNVLDLAALARAGLFAGYLHDADRVFSQATL